MQSGAFLDTILRNVPVCALTSSRLYNFSNIVTYILTYSVMIPMHLGGGGGGGARTPKKPKKKPPPASTPQIP